jgi:hypothetical protein
MMTMIDELIDKNNLYINGRIRSSPHKYHK